MKTPLSWRFAVLLYGLATSVLHLPASAAPGDLDLTFGSGGKVTTAIGGIQDEGRSVAVQGDGKLVVAGSSFNGSNFDFALTRYNANGTLDTGFGSGGKVTTAIGGNDEGRSVAVQGDGKIVVAGYASIGSNRDFALARYNANGDLDTDFGNGGKVTTAIGVSNDQGYSVAVQGDGKIVVAGYAWNGSNNDFALARYNANGTLDTDFGSGGKVTTAIGAGTEQGNSVAVQGDGKIVVAGYSHNGSNLDFALARYNANGTLDPGFGSGGKVTTAIGVSTDQGWSVAVQGDGKIVVAGYASIGSNFDFALARYNANGTLDTDFGSGGKVTTAIGAGTDQGNSVSVQGDGKIVLAGYSHNGSNLDFALARYNANGTLDPGFGSGGKVTTAIGAGTNQGWSVAVQGDGKIVVAGYASIGSNFDFALARYEGGPLKPAVTTGTASEITTTSARLSGTVNPNGVPTTALFETAQGVAAYTAAGNVTAEQGPLSGTTALSVSATKSGLLPHTTYKFRVNASSSAGTSVSDDVTFTTANSEPLANDKIVHPGVVGSTQAIFSAATDTSDADQDTLSVAVPSYSGTGSVEVSDGVVNFTSGLLNGSETVTVEVSDGFGGSDQATITLSNAAPVATTDSVSGAFGEALTIPVLANDSDADSDTLSLGSFTQPAHGTVVVSGSDANVLVYTPEAGFSGADSFSYSVSDGRSADVSGTVSIAIAPVPNPVSSVAQLKNAPVPGAGVEGSGVPTGATWSSFGVPAINDAGQVALLGKWRSLTGTAAAILVDERLVVKTGDPVPGYSSLAFRSFKDPVLNGAGRVAFLATVAGPEVTRANDTVLVSDAFSGSLEVVAREGDTAPESGGATLRSFYSVSLQGGPVENAGLLFSASLLNGSGTPAVSRVNDFGAWLRTPALGASPRKVVREGDPGFATGETIKSFKLLNSLSTSPAQGRGHYAAGGLHFAVNLSSRRQALVRFEAGTLEEVNATDQQLGEFLPATEWKSFGLPATDGSGEVSAVRAVFQGTAGGVAGAKATGILLSQGYGEDYAPVVRVGDAAFGVTGATFSALKDPLVAGVNPSVAFVGTIKGTAVLSGNNTGIWWKNAGGWQLVAREGTQAAEAEAGALWKSFTSVVLPDGETGPLFLASLQQKTGSVSASNDTGVWGVDSQGEVRLLVREGAAVGAKILRSFSTLKAASGSLGVCRTFNNAGQLVYRAYFSDGSQALIKVQLP